jgi:hypothetical protein
MENRKRRTNIEEEEEDDDVDEEPVESLEADESDLVTSTPVPATAQIVSPEKPQKRQKLDDGEEEQAEEHKGEITGNTTMGFPKYPDTCNRDIVLHHFDYVKWARGRTEMYGRLEGFVNWTNSEEGKSLEMQGRGNETFNFGQKRERRFSK